MLLFLARNHSALTHLPIAAAILGAAAALALLFVYRKEVAFCWAVLSITAFVTVIPTVVTGIAAARGRLNDEGKPYIQSGFIVDNVPANARIQLHQILGISGSLIAAVLALLGISRLRGGNPNKYLIFLLALLLAILWGIGGHLGGEELLGGRYFPRVSLMASRHGRATLLFSMGIRHRTPENPGDQVPGYWRRACHDPCLQCASADVPRCPNRSSDFGRLC